MSPLPSGARALRWTGAALLVALSAAAATEARAQEEALLDLPHRARAILPAGLVQLESMYVGHPTVPIDVAEMHHVFTRLEARVPYEHLLLTASVIEGWRLVRLESPEGSQVTGLSHVIESPRLGAAYRDAIGAWRYELGGATTIPIRHDELVRRWEEPPSTMVMPLFPTLPLQNLLRGSGHPWGGWNQGQQLEGWSIQARARVEVDAIAELVLAAEVVSELMVPLDGRGPWPLFHTAVEGAYRFDELGLLGLRAQLVTDVEWQDPLVLLEANVRVGWLERNAGSFVQLGVPVVLRPSWRSPLGAPWSVGVRASAGAVF